MLIPAPHAVEVPFILKSYLNEHSHISNTISSVHAAIATFKIDFACAVVGQMVQ